MRAAIPVVLLLGTLCLASACHTMRFEVSGEPAADVVVDRKSFFLWGLTPTKTVDLREKCPLGVVAIEEEETFGDGFLGAITLGIWAPRTSRYYCRLGSDK